ncbi:MAG: ABC-type transporter, integral rane subunit [Patescibacteria group bacterium]|nr:ABC-type transporter, integral rane subunit [Patescibacteria group bacterium]
MFDSLNQIFTYHFMVNAFRAGTIVAIAAGIIGWFMVLRRQSFGGHTLAVVAFPGAAAATLLGVSATFGFFAFSISAALIIAIASKRGGQPGAALSEESAVIGTVQAFALAAGFLFVSLYHGALNGVNSLLFGSFLGINDSQVVTLLIVGLISLAALAVMGRPLLFAATDPDVALARRVPVRMLSVAFLVLLGLAAAEVSQITGALLAFALLVLPPATAQLLTPNPVLSITLAVAIGLAVTWLSLIVAFYSPYPLGFFITTFAFAGYLLALIWRRSARRRYVAQ